MLILPVTPIFVLAVTGNMATAIALVTVSFTITASASATSAATAECCAVNRACFTTISGKMSGPVAPVTHNSTAHD